MFETKTTATVTLGMAGSDVTFKIKNEDGGYSELKLPPEYAKKLGQRLVAISDILLEEQGNGAA